MNMAPVFPGKQAFFSFCLRAPTERVNNSMAAYCPIGSTSVNQTIVRGVAFQVLCATAIFLATGLDFILVYLLFDFCMRAFISRKFSLFVLLAGALSRYFACRVVPVNAQPKVFAARIGFFMSLAILLGHWLGLDYLVLWLGALMCLAAALESFLSICLGCYLYTFFKRGWEPQAETVSKSIHEL